MSLQTSQDAPADGPLTIDSAVSLLSTARKDETSVDDELDPVNPDGATDGDAGIDGDDDAGDQPDGEDDAPETPAGEDDAEDEEDEPEAPVVEPPAFWKPEEKALFATASPDLQKLIATRDAEYGRQVSLAKEETATARKEASAIGEIVEIVDKQLERATEVFRSKWDGVIWADWAREAPEEAFAAKFEFDAEQAELANLAATREATEVEQHRQFLREEAGKLRDLDPVLADPKTGKTAKTELVGYLTEQGYTPQDLKWTGARELSLARKAMLWDRAQAKIAANPRKPLAQTPPTRRSTTAAPVRPAATPAQGSQTRREVENAQARFDKNPSQENALALMRAKRTKAQR